MDKPPKEHSAEQHPPPDAESVIARQLTGELYCIGCGYNLRGLSIRSNCSECGIPVRATILGIVDPHAEELAPLIAPRLSAIGLNAWSIGAFLAVAMVWVLRIQEVLGDVVDMRWVPHTLPWIGVGGLVLSMLGGITMIRPHRMVRRREAIRSAFGVSLYGPLIFVYGQLYLHKATSNASPIFEMSLTRSFQRLAIFILIAGIVWGIRPQAVGLAVRSVVVRTGRVDRQSLIALLAALGIAALGDLFYLSSAFVSHGVAEVFSLISVVVISLGSVLFLVGMVNICLDTIRLYPVLVHPGVGLGDIFETNRQRARRTDNA